jgi:hypothetical protein
VKVPGDGRIYSVGTTYVADTTTQAGLLFSGSPCNSPVGFQVASQMRSVAVLQIAAMDGVIQHQAYFHGKAQFQGGPEWGLSNYARAVAVAPGVNAADTRVVICGDTFDDQLPRAATPDYHGFQGASPTGFIAMFDGTANLLCSYQLYGHANQSQTTITDVAIHHDPVTGMDVVTYCGASTNGVAADTSGGATVSTLAPLHPFAAPPVSSGCGSTIYAAGNTHAGSVPIGATGQWDGFVGRLTAPHANPPLSSVRQTFHSIVGGGWDEALCGITELPNGRFAVVGRLDTLQLQAQSVLNLWCPLTRPDYTGMSACPSGITGCVGLLMIFDASAIPHTGALPTAPLLLEFSTVLGHAGRDTIASDILWHGNRLWIVGTTTDPDFVITPGPSHMTTRPGVASGYLLVTDAAGALQHASYTGDAQSGASAAVGVAAWHEYPDHVAVAGWTTGIHSTVTTPRRTEVLSFFLDSPTDQDLLSNKGLTLVRRSVLAPSSSGESMPGASEANFAQAFFGGVLLNLRRPPFSHLQALQSMSRRRPARSPSMNAVSYTSSAVASTRWTTPSPRPDAARRLWAASTNPTPCAPSSTCCRSACAAPMARASRRRRGFAPRATAAPRRHARS